MSNTLSYTDTIADEAYNKGYADALKKAEKKYNLLKWAAKWFVCNYESTFGLPDSEEGNKEFFEVINIINK